MSGCYKNSSILPLESNIVKQGYVYIKRPPRNGLLRFKSWHKRYFVLRDETPDHPSRLEMYQKEADFCKNSSRRFVLNLDKVVHVGRTEDSKRFRQAFMIVCCGRAPVILADDDPLYTNSWLLAVTLIAEKRRCNHESLVRHGSLQPNDCRPLVDFHNCLDEIPFNVCYSNSLLEEPGGKKYEISIDPTKTSRKNGIEGDYELIVRSWGLSMTRPGKEDYVVHWPLCFIRKFKSETVSNSNKRKSSLVTLELGRRCVTGEGIFQFRSQHGKEIVADMNQAIYHSMSNKILMETISKNRSLTRSKSTQGATFSGNGLCRSSIQEDVQDGFCHSVPLSRQSSGGGATTRRFSRLTVDCGASVVEACNGGGALPRNGSSRSSSLASRQRSQLWSDSSYESRAAGDVKNTSRASVTSSVSSSSSVHSASSAEYIQAGFPCSPGLLGPNSRERSVFHMPDHLNLVNGETEHVETKAEKAAAEGYLEVLPEVRSDADSLSKIYPVLEAPKRASTCSLDHVRNNGHTSLSKTNSAGSHSEADRWRDSPESISAIPEDKHSSAASVSGYKKASSINNGKPPAPLPRPEHTMM